MTSSPPIIVATEDRDRLLDLVARARANQVAEQLEADPLCQEEMSREPGTSGRDSYSGVRESKLIRWLEHTPSVFEMR